jgi:methylthioribose-1-phosphate isomerase
LERGSDVTIEERPTHELLTFQGKPVVAGAERGLGARYPSFDVTPGTLITYLIGFEDVYTPKEFRRKHQSRVEAAGGSGRIGTGKYILIYGVPTQDQVASLISALRVEQAESVLVPEMRPQLWGARIVARELLERKAPTTLIADNMMGTLFAQAEIRKLYLFYTGLTAEGPAGICGSLLAAQLARLHGVPVELFDNEPRTDSTLDSDVSTFMGKRICPDGVAVRALDAEVVPWSVLNDR